MSAWVEFYQNIKDSAWPECEHEERASKQYLKGIAAQAANSRPNLKAITELFNFLNTMDQRRNTHWPTVFPWLVDEFSKHNLL